MYFILQQVNISSYVVSLEHVLQIKNACVLFKSPLTLTLPVYIKSFERWLYE
jgi:hypothetical protein